MFSPNLTLVKCVFIHIWSLGKISFSAPRVICLSRDFSLNNFSDSDNLTLNRTCKCICWELGVVAT